MTSSVFLLVLLSALSHAAWNFAARKALGNLCVIWIGLWLGCAVISPAVVGIAVYKGLPETVSKTTIVCVLATGFLHALYFRLVAAGYEHGEISLVYPIARGSGIALTAVLASLLFRENIVVLGAIGIGLISAGIVMMSAKANRKTNDGKAITLALLIGITIVGYSLTDKLGVQYANPVVYIWFMFMIAALLLTPIVLRRFDGSIRQIARTYMGYSAVIGCGSIATYLIILFAFTKGQVGYIVAVREFSVVLGALAGIIFLKEQLTILKTIAICMIFIGITFIRIS